MANNTKLILHFFFSLLLSLLSISSVRSFVIFLRCFRWLCSLYSSSRFAFPYVCIVCLAFYYLLQHREYNVNAIRPRMSRIIYVSLALHCLFFVSFCWWWCCCWIRFVVCHAFYALLQNWFLFFFAVFRWVAMVRLRILQKCFSRSTAFCSVAHSISKNFFMLCAMFKRQAKFLCRNKRFLLFRWFL